MDLTVVPSFTEVEIEGNERTAVRLSVFKRPLTLVMPVVATNGSSHPELAL
jgi:hypothetical protein